MSKKKIDHEATEFPVCPACGHMLDPDERADHITYWGDEKIDHDCPSCEATFTVEEYVRRSYTTYIVPAGRTVK